MTKEFYTEQFDSMIAQAKKLVADGKDPASFAFGIANACADFAEFEVQTGDFEMAAWLFNEGKRRIAEFTEWAAGGKKSV